MGAGRTLFPRVLCFNPVAIIFVEFREIEGELFAIFPDKGDLIPIAANELGLEFLRSIGAGPSAIFSGGEDGGECAEEKQ